MSSHESRPTASKKVSPDLALLMLEEGFAIRADQDVYQRNPGLHYFNFRKWRQSEDYSRCTQHRNKVYYLPAGEEPIVYTREQVLERIKDSEITIIPPKGQRYKPGQLNQIHADIKRLSIAIAAFIN